MESDQQQSLTRRRARVVRAIIISGWFMSLLVMMAVVGSALYMVLTRGEAPEQLSQWAGVALGFLFGTFTAIVKDYVDDEA